MLPTVCDLFSCLKVGGDKDKWLHRAAEQVSRCLVSAATVALTSPGRAITQLSLSVSPSPSLPDVILMTSLPLPPHGVAITHII